MEVRVVRRLDRAAVALVEGKLAVLDELGVLLGDEPLTDLGGLHERAVDLRGHRRVELAVDHLHGAVRLDGLLAVEPLRLAGRCAAELHVRRLLRLRLVRVGERIEREDPATCAADRRLADSVPLGDAAELELHLSARALRPELGFLPRRPAALERRGLPHPDDLALAVPRLLGGDLLRARAREL